ncbi:MAG TPA: MFS transporter [Actinomycetota bacterium]|nr:MFS transporter [Actinomycetota bacterium]
MASGLSGTVVNVSVTVAVVAIAAEFGASIAAAAATVIMLNVAMAFTMPLAGAWTARLGPRRLIVAAGVVVLGSSVLLSLAPNLALLAIARAAQGTGLAAVVPVSVQASGQLLTGERRAHALGWWGASNGLGLAFAPLIGGAIIELVGWRWVTVPSCLLGLALVITALLAFPADLQRGSTIRLRGLGLVASVSGTGMSALAAASVGAWAVAATLALACGAASVAAARALRDDGELAELRRWSHDRDVRRSSLGATLQMVANGVVQVAVPAWLIVSGVLGAGGAAALLMGMTLTMAAMGPVTGRRGSVSYPSRLRRGLAGCALGLVGLAVAAATGPWWLAAPALVVLGLGAGSLLSPSLTAFSRTTAGESTIALSLFNLARLGSFGLGGLLGGAFVDAGEPGTAFLAVAIVCGLAAAQVGTDRALAADGGDEPEERAQEQTRAPEGAGGGTDDG